MANIKSSKKAIKVIAKKTDNNHELKMRVHNLIKNCEKEIAANNKENADKLLKDFQKYMDKAVSKGLIKKNTADREKSRLTQKVKNMK
ncbi:MAG TPA: 30S ribosomal protein S20 [Candidatus Onthocola stercorigallinarum]|nr:30S ribosomal protein S20 [Candidatus Onthocola stercorigallinarum]